MSSLIEQAVEWVEGAAVSEAEGEIVKAVAPEFTVNASGGKKQTGGKPMFNQVPEAFVAALSKHMDIGAQKYGFGNHAKGMTESQVLEATRRHYAKRRTGENVDPETGSSHYLAIAANAMMAWSLEQAGRLQDDRKGFYIDLEYEVK